jgi:hypothetical protein
MEIIVLLAVVAVVAALTVPTIMQANRLQRVQQTWEILERTRLAAFNATAPNHAFQQEVGRHPGQLSQLVTPITTADLSSCGAVYTAGQVASWTGPYGGSTIVAAVGLPTPIGIGLNNLVRTPVGFGAGTIAILIPAVDLQDALLLDQVFDNADGGAAGNVQWTLLGVDTLKYSWPHTAAC